MKRAFTEDIFLFFALQVDLSKDAFYERSHAHNGLLMSRWTVGIIQINFLIYKLHASIHIVHGNLGLISLVREMHKDRLNSQCTVHELAIIEFIRGTSKDTMN